MLEAVKKLFLLLNPRERRRFYAVVLLAIVSGLFEMLGVASVLPFLAVLSDPGQIERNATLHRLYDGLGFAAPQGFMIFLGFGVLALVLTSLGIRLVAIFAISRFSNMRAYSLSRQLVESYLRQPYPWFLGRNGAQLSKTILIEVQRVVNQAIMPVMTTISQAALVLSLFGLLLVMEPVIALTAVALFGGSYVLVYLVTRPALARIGAVILASNTARFKAVQEVMTSIKDVKILGVERPFLDRFCEPTRRMAVVQAKGAVISEAPRYVLEAMALGAMLVLILYLLFSGTGTLVDILPTLGIFAFAGMRLFPALQTIYRELGKLRVSKPAVDELFADMMETRASPLDWPAEAEGPRLALGHRLELDAVAYAYPAASRTALAGLDLVVPARSTLGIVGGTGAGKTTLVDLILGLLWPDAGAIRVDGVAVTRGNLRAWQNNIGYVPQQISLIDASVTANIAFGVHPERVDMAAVERAARIAELHDFVTTELPQGYDTRVGDRGVRLSGGQRQRIGIARALYRDPDVLILDEATSALDNLTEKAVMDAVHNLGRAKTIIMIAHRLSTVEGCDTIIMMETGRIVASGTYEELLRKSTKFRAMAGVAGS
jgi:ABC-type multidrug transport system fused ATPase/permease subunit